MCRKKKTGNAEQVIMNVNKSTTLIVCISTITMAEWSGFRHSNPEDPGLNPAATNCQLPPSGQGLPTLLTGILFNPKFIEFGKRRTRGSVRQLTVIFYGGLWI